MVAFVMEFLVRLAFPEGHWRIYGEQSDQLNNRLYFWHHIVARACTEVWRMHSST
jgi:hypothetical protein